MTSARPPVDLKHLPFKAFAIAQCYPPTPENGAAPEDDDASEETEDNHNTLNDSDASGAEVPEDDAVIDSKQRRKINEDLMTTVESSPSGRNDDDADAIPSPASFRETSAPQPIRAAIDIVVDFADQFVRLEVENAQLREGVKSSSDQLQQAKSLAADAQNENKIPKEELKTLKKKLKEEQESKLKAYAEADRRKALFVNPSNAF
ncbi:hypothetical protein QYE76_028053 [Lolium multiflorum]|uniref:Uncharacterized protein n=1 Tax=Lolium multiflorum TaxID=4521 RepID=A0AAD8QK92_LOLMU|nr:hypothetical protein QYE76_028053 [Lolium multiflorum]